MQSGVTSVDFMNAKSIDLKKKIQLENLLEPPAEISVFSCTVFLLH